ncbi:hypothetical protein OEA41_010848 [Lepraria neglecta]|uniref:Zn(2)-C6 fungal-type domain-containing protein n=1 Tax=Lepraria neglecta TaxID=209136 RepID=A0AAD9YXC3_9LECA|nr:hypothetical protein OEA41_010848 [Lepraria neglecta]
MSASGAAVTRNPLISNPRESKRGACDRCRGQKLRCLREDQSQDSTCVRCFKAGAICSFGAPKRAGRLAGSSSFSPQERRGNGGGSPKQGGIPSRPTANTSGHGVLFESKADGGLHQNRSGGWDDSSFLRENTAEEESGEETEDTIPAHTMSPSSLFDTSNILGGADVDFPAIVGSSTATLPWPDETLLPFYNDNVGEASGLEPFGPKYSWAFQHYHAGPMDMQMLTASPISNDGQTRDVGVNAYATAAPTRSTNVQRSRPSDEAMEIDLPSALNQPIKVPYARKSRARDRDKDRARAPTSFSVSSTAKPSLLKDSAESEAGSTVNEETSSVKEGQYRRMQELSELAMDLYAQLAANDPENHPPASAAPATAFQDQLVGSVLKSSNTFLTLLTSFSTPVNASPAYQPAPPPFSSTNPDASTCSSSFSGVSPPAPNDMTTVLQLLTCYIRIARLHSIMYTSMLEYTLAFPGAASPHLATIPPVFPGLQIGGVSLDAFGTLQVVLLLQIAVHVLGEIEVALGLPEEYRVGRRKGGGRGVLEVSVSSGFVKCLMREEVWRGKRVECIREQLSQLKRVLKGAIDF